MIYVLISISAVFIVLGFSLTENNAKYMLAGFNTMTEEERKKIDIKGLVPYFRNFHIFLGLSFLLMSMLLISYVNLTIATIFICIYPVAAEIYFVISTKKITKKI